uniref:hypothetical protein n=1 Tax=Clavibacter michiganensis TaxID=28447 RepID=UPI00292DE9E3
MSRARPRPDPDAPAAPTAAAAALLVLPAALVVCGRGLFWPFVPRVGTDADHGGKPGVWRRL